VLCHQRRDLGDERTEAEQRQPDPCQRQIPAPARNRLRNRQRRTTFQTRNRLPDTTGWFLTATHVATGPISGCFRNRASGHSTIGMAGVGLVRRFSPEDGRLKVLLEPRVLRLPKAANSDADIIAS